MRQIVARQCVTFSFSTPFPILQHGAHSQLLLNIEREKLMKKILLLAGILASQTAFAHVSYTGRDFGVFDGLTDQSVTISNQTTRSHGWADAADADWGDTHQVKWFTFSITNQALVTISASALANATATSLDGLLPGFSLYEGKAPGAAYDSSAVTSAYRNTLGFDTEGALNALGNFEIGNDAGVISKLSFVGYAADGTSNNLGNLPAVIGDGTADGFVSSSFLLNAGTYTLIIGGADYASQNDPLSLAYNYGLSATVSVAAVPEPSTYALMVLGLGIMGIAVRSHITR
ncbi:PEP-CTERM sorting domain-containing protein [Methylobacillus sp.]|uniref:PEP-CTERM sorting domain-containing protein n=1 Tax=Methylobacillus sp. TaxID=56818 RepID=UPI002FE25E42